MRKLVRERPRRAILFGVRAGMTNAASGASSYDSRHSGEEAGEDLWHG